MAEPLKPTPVAPEPKVTLSMSPVATPVHVQSPAAAPDLFHDTQMLQPSYQPQQLEPEQMLDDDLPPPVYRAQQPVAQPRATAPVASAHDADAASFVAPRPRAAGTPSAEAMARLQAAVSKAPSQASRPAPQQQPQRAAAPAPKAAEPRPRFGIGSLINRMAGGHSEPAQERPQAGRQQPPVTAYDDEQELSADQERIEIPAFLRRQAN